MSKDITVSGLKKSFKDMKVLQDVNFSVAGGQIFALLGSNGAGKTTIIKIMTTLMNADSGTVLVGGFDVSKQAESVREIISLTGQFAAVDEILTGRENLQMMGKLRHIDNVNAVADRMLERFDLVEAGKRPVATYSGGMRRRLDIAMSLIGDPKIIFLDEPTTGLDPQARISMWKIIKDLAEAGTTVFLTTQYLEEADQLADQIAILHMGKIIVQGSASELKQLLPQGHIELRFFDEETATQAMAVLATFETVLDTEMLTLTIETDGTIKQMTAILNSLEQANVTVVEYAQKLPTLEDVFLSIVGDENGMEG